MRLQTQVAPEIQKRLLLSRVEAESLPDLRVQDTKSFFRCNRTFECEVSEMQECPYLKSRLLPQNPQERIWQELQAMKITSKYRNDF